VQASDFKSGDLISSTVSARVVFSLITLLIRCTYFGITDVNICTDRKIHCQVIVLFATSKSHFSKKRKFIYL
jgi:hypothetical protein